MNKKEETILDRIKQIADSKGMSIAEVERKSNIGNGIIRRWDKSIPTADKLQNVAKTLGADMNYLLTGEESESDSEILARDLDNLTENQYDLVHNMIKEFKKANNVK